MGFSRFWQRIRKMHNLHDGVSREPNLLKLYKQVCIQEQCHPNSAVVYQLTHECAGGTLPFASLNLQNNYLGPRGLRPVLQLIAHCQTVQTIVLDGNGVDNDTVRQLCSILRTHIGVFSLSLRNNPLSSPSAAYLLQLLHYNVNITHVDVHNSDIPDVMQHRIQVALDKNGRRCAHRELLRLIPYTVDELDSEIDACLSFSSSNPSHVLPNILLSCPIDTREADHIDIRSTIGQPADFATPAHSNVSSATRSAAEPVDEDETNAHSCVRKVHHVSSMNGSRPRNANTHHRAGNALSMTQTISVAKTSRALSHASAGGHSPATLSDACAAAVVVTDDEAQSPRADETVSSTHGDIDTSACRAVMQQRIQAIHQASAMHGMDSTLPSSTNKVPAAQPLDARERAATRAHVPLRCSCRVRAREQSRSDDADGDHTPPTDGVDSASSLEGRVCDQESSLPVCTAVDETRQAKSSDWTSTNTCAERISLGGGACDTHIEHEDGAWPSESLCQSQAANDTSGRVLEKKATSAPAAEEATSLESNSPTLGYGSAQSSLGAGGRFRVLFDSGGQCYARGKLEEAYLVWSDALDVATITRNPEWIAVTSTNLQHLSYELLTTEGNAQVERGQLVEAEESFALALQVAIQARNAAWESAIRQAQTELQRLVFQRCHATAQKLLDQARAMVAPSYARCELAAASSNISDLLNSNNKNDSLSNDCSGTPWENAIAMESVLNGFFVVPGTPDTRVQHTAAFIRIWPALLCVREAIVIWTRAAYVTASTISSNTISTHATAHASFVPVTRTTPHRLGGKEEEKSSRCADGTQHTRNAMPSSTTTALDQSPPHSCMTTPRVSLIAEEIYSTVGAVLDEVGCFLLQHVFADTAESMTLSWMGTQHYQYHESRVLIQLWRGVMDCLHTLSEATQMRNSNNDSDRRTYATARATAMEAATTATAATKSDAYSSTLLPSALSPFLLAVIATQLGNLYLATYQLTLAEREFNYAMHISAMMQLPAMEAMAATFAALLAEHRSSFALAERYFTQAIPNWQRVRMTHKTTTSSSLPASLRECAAHNIHAASGTSCAQEQSNTTNKVCIQDHSALSTHARCTPKTMHASSASCPHDVKLTHRACFTGNAQPCTYSSCFPASHTDGNNTDATAAAAAAAVTSDGHCNATTHFAEQLCDAIPLEYVDMIEHVCHSHRVILLTKTFRPREALEVLESALTNRYRDLLNDKICTNFTTAPTLGQLAAIAESARSPLVYYVLHKRFDWQCEVNRYNVEESVMIWVVTTNKQMRHVEVNVSTDYRASVTALLQSARQAMYVNCAESVSSCLEDAAKSTTATTPTTRSTEQAYSARLGLSPPLVRRNDVSARAGVSSAVCPGVVLTLPHATWMAPLRTLYKILIRPIWHLLIDPTVLANAPLLDGDCIEYEPLPNTSYSAKDSCSRTDSPASCAECAKSAARTMTIIPTGLLWQVPFSALIGSDDEKDDHDGVHTRKPNLSDDNEDEKDMVMDELDHRDKCRASRINANSGSSDSSKSDDALTCSTIQNAQELHVQSAKQLSCRKQGWHYLVERMTIQMALSALQWSLGAVSAEQIRLRRGIQQLNRRALISLCSEVPSSSTTHGAAAATTTSVVTTAGAADAVPLANIAERNIVVVLPGYNYALGDACLRGRIDRTPFPFDPERSVREGRTMMHTWRAIRQRALQCTCVNRLWPSERLIQDMDAVRQLFPQARTLHIACPVVSGDCLPDTRHRAQTEVATNETNDTNNVDDDLCAVHCAGVCVGGGGSSTRSGCALTLLESHALAQMQLFSEVVVLSETTLGAMSGVQAKCDPVMCAIRAFLCAGAPCVIAGLWCTPDMKPSELFSLFYQMHYASSLCPGRGACPRSQQLRVLSARTESCETADNTTVNAAMEDGMPDRDTTMRSVTRDGCTPEHSCGHSAPTQNTSTDKAVSLCRAIRVLLRDDAVRYNPRIWAAYVLIGCGLL